MRTLDSRKTSWLVAGALALGGVGLSTRDSAALQRLIAEFTSTSSKCTTDAHGNPFIVEAAAFNAAGVWVCGTGAIATGTGTGASAESLCSDPVTGVNRATQQDFELESYDISTGQVVNIYCGQSVQPWGTSQTCNNFPAPVTSTCPANNSISAAVLGETF
jgi:hypothetical protein